MTALMTLLIFCDTVTAQTSGTIHASATVVEATGIQLIPMKDMIIDEASAKDGILEISPVSDEKAGKMLVKGKANSSIRLSYLNELSLVNSSGEGTLVCKYVVSGFKSDNQGASQLLDQVERIVQFNDKGEFYLWLGGRVNLSRARPGSYDGEFTIQIEYI
ncbi:MAG: hypothetical protein ACOYNC_12255 [Bacteroidales bacterium]